MEQKEITSAEMERLLRSQQGELDGAAMYLALADVVKDEKDAETFRKLAADEGRHAAAFKNLTQQTLTPNKKNAARLTQLYKVLGKKGLYPMIAKREYEAVDGYLPLAERFPELESVRNDEKRHGDTVMSLLEKGDKNG